MADPGHLTLNGFVLTSPMRLRKQNSWRRVLQLREFASRPLFKPSNFDKLDLIAFVKILDLKKTTTQQDNDFPSPI